MSLRRYTVVFKETIEDLATILREICRVRDEDIQQFNNLQNTFIAGRKVARIPSSSADVLDTDNEGDFNATPSFLYILVDNSGTLVWRRVALASW